MKTRILLISSSPRKKKGKTFVLADEVLKGASQEGADTDIIHLADFRILFCKHCQACHRKILNCSIEDDAIAIIKKMQNADGIIFATPNYIKQITASMKALFERGSHLIHCKGLLGKYVTGVVSSGSGQDKEVLDYIRLYGLICGAQYSGGVSSAENSVDEKMQAAFELGRRMVSDIRAKQAYPDQLKAIQESKEHFKQLVELQKGDWKEEYAYWQGKGWL